MALAVVAICGCSTSDPGTPLAKLGSTQLEVVARPGQLNIELHVTTTGDCPQLADDAVARFDGQPMNVARGGVAQNADGCYPISFWFETMPMAQINGVENTSSGSQLVVHDASATWNVDTTSMFQNNFQIDAANAKITWFDVQSITSASVSPIVPVTIQGNTILYPPGSAIDWVDAYAHPSVTRCDGPGVCSVDLEGSRKLGINP